MDMVDMQLKAGDATRVHCSYENDTGTASTFGESTHSEMCFFVAFAVDQRGLNVCRECNARPRQCLRDFKRPRRCSTLNYHSRSRREG